MSINRKAIYVSGILNQLKYIEEKIEIHEIGIYKYDESIYEKRENLKAELIVERG